MSLTKTKPYYLVISNMRSGSSAVSRVMHENMGIKMFIHPQKPDEFNPKGYYEDVEVTNLNELCIRGEVNFRQHIEYMREYIRTITSLHVEWGLKDGRIALLGALYKYLMPDVIKRSFN